VAKVKYWQQQIANWLTMFRLLVTPFIMALLLLPEPIYGYISCGLFILGSLTDWWDGYFARKYGTVSNFGKLMDPIADKIMVSSTLIMMIPSGRVDAILVVVLIARDILIGGVRSLAAIDNVVISAKSSGKWKTAVQMVGIPLVLINTPVFDIPVRTIGYGLIWVSVILSIMSAVEYIRGYFRPEKTR
jgi:CDP-diacylglycerol--glycerol-3-phosphate 3-phosphatidyltransferase